MHRVGEQSRAQKELPGLSSDKLRTTRPRLAHDVISWVKQTNLFWICAILHSFEFEAIEVGIKVGELPDWVIS